MIKRLKNLFIIFVAVLVLYACDMFKLDNYDTPNASFNGKILDEVTGELVGTDVQNGSRMQVQEIGYPSGLMTWTFMQSGEFRNDLVFSGRYSIVFNNCNFYPFKVDNVDIQKGNNTMNFEVTPYIRVKNVNIFIEDEVRLSNRDSEGFSQAFDPIKVIDPNGTYTLKLDLSAANNKAYFIYKTNYYFRVGAIASVPGVGIIRRNYSQLVIIDFRL